MSRSWCDVVMILGNDLAGSAVWANVLQSPVIISKLLGSGEPDERGWRYPGVLPACTVTHARSRNVTAPDPPASVFSDGMVIAEYVVSLPDLPPSVSREE